MPESKAGALPLGYTPICYMVHRYMLQGAPLSVTIHTAIGDKRNGATRGT